MKTIAISSFFVLFALAAGIVATTPAAFADHSEVTIVPAAGSGAPGCEATADGCYIPSTATVDVGGVVIMSNTDTAAHTYTSGNPTDGPDGIFDTSLLMAGGSFEWSPDTVGEYDYFCMVHPWMVGTIIVQEVEAEDMMKDDDMMMKDDDMMMKDDDMMMKDDDMMMETEEDIYVTLDHDISGGSVTEMEIEMDSNSLVIVVDSTDNGSISVTLPRDVIDATNNGDDDDFFVIVDGEEVDFQETKTSTDRTLTIEFPAGAEEIEIFGTFVVPEFGTIAAMILAVAIISIIAVSAKSRLSIMPRL
jgi:predicted secreted protein with PEFG-CTERM motif